MNNSIRIIGGQWRGRRLTIPAAQGLRPTPDAARETVFNWLSAELQGARCLDLFAGSGAFGFECLSRGADFCTMVDHNSRVIRSLIQSAHQFDASDKVKIIKSDAPAYVSRSALDFDLIFLDPPYTGHLLALVLKRLQASKKPSSTASPIRGIIVDCDHDLDRQTVPENWIVTKSSRHGQCHCHLLRPEIR